jgi:hypothetical protein
MCIHKYRAISRSYSNSGVPDRLVIIHVYIYICIYKYVYIFICIYICIYRAISRSNSNSVVPESLVMTNPQSVRKNKINSVHVISPSFVVPELGSQDGDEYSVGQYNSLEKWI